MKLAFAYVVTSWLTLSLSAQTITGTITDQSGIGLSGINVETADGLFAGTSGTGGTFSLPVAAGTYDLNVIPPTTLAPVQVPGLTVSGTLNVGTIVLVPGFTLTGTVVNPAGAIVAGADMNVYDDASGAKLLTPSDNTDVTGNFSVIVPAGTFRVRATPPTGVILAPVEISNVVVTGPTNVGTLALLTAFALTGTAINGSTMAPVFDADIDVDDAITGRRLPTPNDNTNAAGAFSVLVPTGFYHVTVSPPAGSPLVTTRTYNIIVTGATAMGSIPLPTGLVVTGTVRGPGGVPVVGADLDVDTAPGGYRIPVAGDVTDATGQFSIVLPSGTYSLAVRPPFATGLVGARVSPLVVTGTTNVGVLNLSAGVVVSGTITGWNGLPEAFADLDVINPVTGVEIVTTGDRTNANGAYALVAPPGNHSVAIETRKGSLSRNVRLNGLSFSGPTTLNPVLMPVPVGIYFDSLGLPTVTPGAPLVTNIGIFNPNPTTQTVAASLVVIDPLGNQLVLLPPTTLPIVSATPLLLFGALLPAPPAAPSLLGQRFRYEIRFTEVGSGIPIDSDGFEFIVQ